MIRFITCFFILCSVNLQASIQASGRFQTTQTCPAYLSKNSKSNPDNLTVQTNEAYELREINKASPNWVRIVIPGTYNPLRWVSTQCGVVAYQERNTDSCDRRRGKADAHILALSSQPGFCQTYGYEAGKPECLNLSKHAYQANHLSLHGLWPNQNSCGRHYGYCDVQPKPNHCDYSPLNLTKRVSDSLNTLMPSYHYGTCLERHEWSKHGSCQMLSDNEYFSLALRLAIELNNTEFGQYLTENKGRTIPLTTLRKRIDAVFGAKNRTKVSLACKNGFLVDVFITLPALISSEASLESLVSQAPIYRHNDACPKFVTLSDFHKEVF